MDTNFLDSDIPHAFWPSMSEAKRRALKEAVDTGGIVFDVQAIELEKSLLVMVGSVALDAVQAQPAGKEGRIMIRVQRQGRFHTTWGALLFPRDSLGFFILRPPVLLNGGTSRAAFENIRVAMAIKRRFASIASCFIGPVCCIDCNQTIPTERLKAVPGVRSCLNCQQEKEKMKKWK